VIDTILGHLMLAFDGLDLPEPMRRRLTGRPAAGISLFRHRNVESPAQVRRLTDAIQACAPEGRPFLIAIDQEGGQLRGLGEGSTPFPGNMALGAVGDPDLTKRVAMAIGRELSAAGVNLNYAPVADLATNPANPSLGVRSFGDDPTRVARHVAAFVSGLESVGVAAALKHFPGKGDAGVDTHHELATVRRSVADLEARELVPFRAGIGAGASVVMSGHFALPEMAGDQPATLARPIMSDLLRGRLGFGGVSISDSFDMDALSAGAGRLADAVTGINAGLDLLLLGGRSDHAAFDAALARAADAGEIDEPTSSAGLERVAALRSWLAGRATSHDVATVGGEEHRALAAEAARRAITLVRDAPGLLPLRPPADASVLVIMPRPVDRTPADTSSDVSPGLAAAVRAHHRAVVEMVVDPAPDDAAIAATVEAAKVADLVIVGTISASLEPRQAALVRAVLAAGRPTVTVALRTPWDLQAYPEAGTHLCTYSILDPSLAALADVLFGRASAGGTLPVSTGGGADPP
jgi:beta-N-acetylhexosaminidase